MESFIFGSEFFTLQITSELIISLYYKLQMFGIPIFVHADVFCNNEALSNNADFSESTLKGKKKLLYFLPLC